MSHQFQVVRKHILIDKYYLLVYDSDTIRISADGKAPYKYTLNINLHSRILWKVDGDGHLNQLGIYYLNKQKWFHAKSEHLVQLKRELQCKIFFNSIQTFYSSHEVLGSGASCKVIMVTDHFTKQRFAAKCISKEYITKKKTIDRFNRLMNEINILQRLKKLDNIVELIEVYESDSSYYLLFELLEGMTLHRFIKTAHKHLQEDIIRLILQQLLIGLKGLHDQKYIHRDIKLENIVFSKAGEITNLKIIDFGLAISLNEQIPFSVCGTPGYIAPEILQYEDLGRNPPKFKYNSKLDLFGIGVILFRLMTRQPLFESDKTKDLLTINKRCQIHKIFIQGYSNELNEILYCLLDSNPTQRLSADEALQLLTENRHINQIRGVSITTTKSQDHIKDDFEVEVTNDFANIPYQFPAGKKHKISLEASFHQNDDILKLKTQPLQSSLELIQLPPSPLQDFIIEK